MFREMRRFKQQVSEAEVKRVLQEGKRAALAVHGDDGYPYVIPLNYYYDAGENKIYFHCAKAGHKSDAMEKDDKVCLTVWDNGFKKDGRWEWNVTSVVAFGRARKVEDFEDAKKRVRKLAEKYYPNEEDIEFEMNSSAINRMQIYAIEIEHMTGKLVNER